MRLLAALLAVVVTASLVGSIAVVRRVHRPTRRWRDMARERLVYGVPWGSLVVIAFVVAVYLFVQSGIADFDDPVTIPFRTWSYFYPLGLATAAFSHAGPGHLIGNLAGTVVVAPLAEYAWGQLSGRPRAEPFRLVAHESADTGVRALSAGRHWGRTADEPVRARPRDRLLGVVFALAGFAIVHYPIVTIVRTLGVQSVVLRLYYALQEPISVYTAQPSPPSAPSWAGIAIQGHALGLFVGFVLGIVLLERRDVRPNPFRLWLAVLLFGFSEAAVGDLLVRSREHLRAVPGPGVAIVSALALVVTLSLTASERPLIPAEIRQRFARSRDRTAELPVTLSRRSVARSSWPAVAPVTASSRVTSTAFVKSSAEVD